MDSAWAQKQWGEAKLGDGRLTKRAVKLGEACVVHPEKSLPQKFEDWASIKGACRFLASPKVTHRDLQVPHYQNVLEEAARSQERVLFIQDGSELLFNSHPLYPWAWTNS